MIWQGYTSATTTCCGEEPPLRTLVGLLSTCSFHAGYKFCRSLITPWVKLTTDGSYLIDVQVMGGYGALVRAPFGELLGGFFTPVEGASSFDAEFRCLLHAIRLVVHYTEHI